ncbi:MAG TPA: hypothetical protein VNQ90_03790 [Chthoniobacteraceae bacterium]|nr:hypothetical protein [Chthoniobacteraceae bacterium]
MDHLLRKPTSAAETSLPLPPPGLRNRPPTAQNGVRTALTLQPDDLQRIAAYVRGRMETIDETRRAGWIAERERFEQEWNDDFSHRHGAVFSRSNESLNMIGSGIDYIRSRMVEEIFGSKPWFSADPRPRSGCDVALSDQVSRHLQWKLGPNQINFEGVAADLITQACKLGECVAKVFYQTREETYERIASILWDTRRDAPVLGRGGDFVFQGESAPPCDEWRPGEPETALVEPQAHQCWKERIVSERKVHYTGAKAVPLHFKEFYCPLNAPSLHDADFVAHLTSLRLSQLCAHLGISFEELDEPETADGEEPPRASYLVEALRRIRRSQHHSATPAVAASREEGSEKNGGQEHDPEFRLLEAYFEFDARNDGRPCRIFLLMAYDFDLPLFWDYIANVTPNGRYPFEAVTINKEPHRWYGRSWFKKYEKFQQLIDKLLNQILYRNELAANPVKFRRKEAVVQWQDDQPFEIGPDKVFDLNDGYTAADALQTARIPELDEQTNYLLEMAISSWRTRSGITTATQGVFGSLPSERTATGVTQIVQSGATIFKPQVMDIKRGLEAVLRQIVDYQYSCQTGDETFTYHDGERRVEGTLCRERLAELQFNVELTLSRARQLQRLESARVAVDFFGRFLALPDPFKPVAAPLFSTIFKSLEIDHADAYFHRIVEIADERNAPATEEA